VISAPNNHQVEQAVAVDVDELYIRRSKGDTASHVKIVRVTVGDRDPETIPPVGERGLGLDGDATRRSVPAQRVAEAPAPLAQRRPGVYHRHQ
jgi:hypothetical protein